MNKEIESVNMLRGIAALAVCFMHFTGTVNSIFLKEIGQYGGNGVYLFFVISGFILPYAMEKSGYKIKHFFLFISKRIIRLDPAYLLTILCIIFISSLAKYPSFNPADFLSYFNSNTFYHLFYLVDILKGKWLSPVFWTLAIEFQFYLLIALIFPLFITKKILWKSIIFCLCCVLPFVLPHDAFLPNYLLMFLPGLVLFEFYQSRINRITFFVLILITLILSVFKSGIIGFICPTFAISFILYFRKPIKPLLFLGKISYSLYLIHTPIGTDGFIHYLQHYFTEDWQRLVLMFISFPVIIFCAWFFYKLIEEPSIKLSKRIMFAK